MMKIHRLNIIHMAVMAGTIFLLLTSASVSQKKHLKKTSAVKSPSTLNSTKKTAVYGKYDFTVRTLDGKTVKLSDYSGRVVLVNIWAPWCGPCKLETPGFIKIYDQNHKKGFEIMGVAVQTNESDVRSFLEKYHVPWPVSINDAVAENYGTYGLPDNYLFGRDGSLLEHFIGYTNDERLRTPLEKALQQ